MGKFKHLFRKHLGQDTIETDFTGHHINSLLKSELYSWPLVLLQKKKISMAF